VYEKELLALVFAVQKWQRYLTSQRFIIRTDQRSLKWWNKGWPYHSNSCGYRSSWGLLMKFTIRRG